MTACSACGEKTAAKLPRVDVTPVDVTPVAKAYVSPGLGDNMDAVHFTVMFGHSMISGEKLQTTYEQALTQIRRLYYLTNGAHLIPFALGNDVGRFGTAPELIPDDAYPMGDGPPGSGYRRFSEYTDDALRYNAHICQILEPALEGNHRNDYIDASAAIAPACKDDYRIHADEYGYDADGNKTWWYTWANVSMSNRMENGSEQEAWVRNMAHWRYRMHVYFDALVPRAYHMRNEYNAGGRLTTDEREMDACVRLAELVWQKYGISSSQEFADPVWKGYSCYFTYGAWGSANCPVDETVMDYWGNGIMVSDRQNEIANLVWGTEYNPVFTITADTDMNTFIQRYFLYNAQYLYMMEQEPLSYINDETTYSVTYTNGLVTRYDRATGRFTMTQGDFVLADGLERLIPQVGAGCKLYAYSHNGSTCTRVLPESWKDIETVDIYRLSIDRSPVREATVEVTERRICLTMAAGVPYLLVPAGNAPTPTTISFDEPELGTAMTNQYGICWEGGFLLRQTDPKSGFGTPYICPDCQESSWLGTITLPVGSIFHSIKVGNLGGEGKITLYSSNADNRPVVMTLPQNGQIFKLNTGWRYAESGAIRVVLAHENGVENIALDWMVYTDGTVL